MGDKEENKPRALLLGFSQRYSQFLENEAPESNYSPLPSLVSTNCILIDQLASAPDTPQYSLHVSTKEHF